MFRSDFFTLLPNPNSGYPFPELTTSKTRWTGLILDLKNYEKIANQCYEEKIICNYYILLSYEIDNIKCVRIFLPQLIFFTIYVLVFFFAMPWFFIPLFSFLRNDKKFVKMAMLDRKKSCKTFFFVEILIFFWSYFTFRNISDWFII